MARSPRRHARPVAHVGAAQVGFEAPARPRRPARLGVAAPKARRAGDRRRHPPLHDEHRRPARRVLRVTADAGRAVGERRHRHLGGAAVGRHRVRHGAPQDRRHRRRSARGLGLPRGGMGAVSDALRSAAESFGAVVRTDAPVQRILVQNGRATGVVLQSGEEIRADVVVAATHPRLTFLEHIDRSELPDDFVADIERWKSRSGTVKVNLALDRLPEFTGKPGFDPEVHGGTIVLAESLDEIEGAFQDAVAGTTRGGAVRRHLHPLRVRPVTRSRGQARHVDVHAVGSAPVLEQGRDVGAAVGARRVRRPRDRASSRSRPDSPLRSCTAR